MSYPDISLQGVKRVKISLKYRTDVNTETLHGGSWYLVGFQFADGKIKYDGIILPRARTAWGSNFSFCVLVACRISKTESRRGRTLSIDFGEREIIGVNWFCRTALSCKRKKSLSKYK
jgi:hypothetical protein